VLDWNLLWLHLQIFGGFLAATYLLLKLRDAFDATWTSAMSEMKATLRQHRRRLTSRKTRKFEMPGRTRPLTDFAKIPQSSGQGTF